MLSINCRNSEATSQLGYGEKYNCLLILFSVVIALTPDLNRYFSKTVWIIVIILWYADIFFRKAYEKSIVVSPLFLGLIIGLSVDIALKLVGYSSAEIGNYYIKIAFVDMLIKACYVNSHYSNKSKMFIFRFVEIYMGFLVIVNIYNGLTIPSVHYYIYFFPEKYLGKNIAMTEFFDCCAFFSGVVFYRALYEKRRAYRFFDYTILIITIYFLLSFEPRTTAIVLAFVFIIINYLCFLKKTTTRLFVAMALIFVAFGIMTLGRDLLISIMPDRVSIRLSSVFNYVSDVGNADSSDYLSRFRLFFTSIKTFTSNLKNFVFGVGYHLGGEYDTIIGQHSFIVDSLAAYGCIGFLYIVTVYRYIRKELLKDNKRIIKNALIVLLISAFLSNPIRPEIASCVLLLPVCSEIVLRKKGENL